MMGGKILRETFDRNLNQVLRLRTLENGKNFFTAIPILQASSVYPNQYSRTYVLQDSVI